MAYCEPASLVSDWADWSHCACSQEAERDECWSGVQLAVSFPLSSGFQPMEWYCPHLGKAFLLQLTPPQTPPQVCFRGHSKFHQVDNPHQQHCLILFFKRFWLISPLYSFSFHHMVLESQTGCQTWRQPLPAEPSSRFSASFMCSAICYFIREPLKTGHANKDSMTHTHPPPPPREEPAGKQHRNTRPVPKAF